MEELLGKIAQCIEAGKVDKDAAFPPDMKGQDGASELAKQALDNGISVEDVLQKGLIVGMQKIGVKFRANEVFVPQVLMSARAMSGAMEHLKPFFQSGQVKRKGTFVIGTVAGDLHDIGKNLVSIMVEGGGWEVIDLGTDVSPAKFIDAAKEHPGCAIGLSALLTTTMANMEQTVKELREASPETKILIGGAPVTEEFKESISADFYSADPQGAVEFLNQLA